MRARWLGLGGALALAACAHGGGARPATQPGLAITIHVDRATGAGRAFVDDRRWLAVPADGWVELPDVALDVELDSVVLAAVDGRGGLTASECAPAGVARGVRDLPGSLGRAVEVTVAGGAVIAGALVALGEPVTIVDDRALGRVEASELEGSAGPIAGAATVGETVRGVTAGGDRVLGRVVSVGPQTLTIATPDGLARPVALAAVAAIRIVDDHPGLRCRVTSRAPGRQLVRLCYASPGFGWTASYRVELAGEAAITAAPLTPRYTIVAPGLPTPRAATVRLVAGLPEGPIAPAEAWRGALTVGGGPVVVTGATEARPARTGWVYRGALPLADDGPAGAYWHAASHGLVWRELALAPAPTDVAGPLEVVLDGDATRRVRAALPAPALEPAIAVRVPLATSATLIGYRHKRELARDDRHVVDEILYSVANHGDRPVEVTIEEELRYPVGAVVRFERPEPAEGGGELKRDRWRRVVTVAPDGVARGAVVVQYRTPTP